MAVPVLVRCAKRILYLVRQVGCLSMMARLLLLMGACAALQPAAPPSSLPHVARPPLLAGDWADAKAALRSPDACVVSVSGLEPQLKALHERWAVSPGDLDLRMRVSGNSSTTRDDCLRVSRAVGSIDGGSQR